MTTSDLLAAIESRRDLFWAVVAILGYSAHPPRWLARLRRLPLSGIATALEWIAKGLRVVAGEVPLPDQSEAPSAPNPEVAGNTKPKENP